MRYIALPLLLLCVICGCGYHRVTVDRDYKFSISSIEEGNYMSQDEEYAEWFEGNNSTTNFCIRVQVGENFLAGFVINVSKCEQIVRRGHFDLPYVMIYEGIDGSRHYSVSGQWIPDPLEAIQVLQPETRVGISISSDASFWYTIPIPKDCAKILAVSVAVEHMTFPEINSCKDAHGLRKLFKNNTEYVRVEYFDY